MRWRFKSLPLRLFTQPFVQAQIKENTKAPRHWPLWGKFIGDRWIPHIKGQKRGKCFHLMTAKCHAMAWRTHAVVYNSTNHSTQQHITLQLLCFQILATLHKWFTHLISQANLLFCVLLWIHNKKASKYSQYLCCEVRSGGGVFHPCWVIHMCRRFDPLFWPSEYWTLSFGGTFCHPPSKTIVRGTIPSRIRSF